MQAGLREKVEHLVSQGRTKEAIELLLKLNRQVRNKQILLLSGRFYELQNKINTKHY